MLLGCIGAVYNSHPPKNHSYFPETFWTIEERHNPGHHLGRPVLVRFAV